MLWLIPLVSYSSDAHAWGLYTHVYFAQLLAWCVPLADPRLRRAVREFPRLVMAGACLPDLAIIARWIGTEAFDANHQWETVARLNRSATRPQEIAVAAGYASHLLCDVIAHNHFVPAHEILWLDHPMLTHIAAEWAMDHHLHGHIFARPAELLTQDAWLQGYVATHFGCGHAMASKALDTLARGDSWLRDIGIPHGLYRAARLFDTALCRRFDRYVRSTQALLPQLERILAGERPDLDAEATCRVLAQARVQTQGSRRIRMGLTAPENLFQPG